MDFGLLAVADGDSATLTATFTATNGILHASLSGGTTVTSGALGSATFTLQGIIGDLNATLASLSYQGNADYNGAATVDYSVADGTYSSGTQTLNLTVNATNDAPTSADKTVTTNEDTSLAFVVGDFAFNDIDTGDTLKQIRLQAPTDGILWVDGDSSGALDNGEIAVANNDVVALADIPKLTFLPDLDANGTGHATFQFEVHDGTDFAAAPNTITVDVTAVNDAPAIHLPATLTMVEDTPLVFGKFNLMYGQVSTLAGNGTAGNANGSGASAQFNFPSGSVTDAEGNIYVMDHLNKAIRKVTPAGDVTTFAGGTSGGADGNGVSAQFEAPVKATMDSAGNMYVTSSAGAHTIRKVTPAGDVTTIAGVHGQQGTADGSGTAARFSHPGGIAWDAANNWLYVTETTGHRIRKIDLNLPGTDSNFVTTLAGNTAGFTDATGASALFNEPRGLRVGPSGNLFVADRNNNRIRMVTPAGVVTTIAGDGNPGHMDGTGTSAQLNGPMDVHFLEPDKLLVAEDGGYIRLVDLANFNEVSTIFGDGTATTTVGDLATATTNLPISLSSHGSLVYFTDWNAHNLRVLALENPEVLPVDVDGDNLTVALTATNGTLSATLQGGATFTAGANNSATFTVAGSGADVDATLATLQFTPDSDFNGAATLTTNVSDGTLTSADSVANITVNAIVDAPTAANHTVTTNEDTAYTFAAGDFQFADVNAGDVLASVKITTLEVVGSLKLSGSDVVLDQVITKSEIDGGNLVFEPVAEANGTGYDTFGFSVNDGTLDSAAAYTMTIDVTSVNDAPTAMDNTVGTNEDTAYTFTASDFLFADTDAGDVLASVKVTTLETVGALKLSGSDVVLDQVVTKSEIDGGNLTFEPVPDGNGLGYDTFGFSVNDGTLDSASAYTMTIDVNAVEDLPVTSDNSITVLEDNIHTFSASDFPFSDADGDALSKLRLQAATAGQFWVDVDNNGLVNDGESVVPNGGEVLLAFIPSLKFLPDPDAHGAGYATFQFEVHDGNGYSNPLNTMTIDVTPVNDLPTAANHTVNTNEDTAYTFLAADFQFADVDTGDVLASVKITTLESVGSLKLAGSDVTLNQVITKSEIDAGDLVFEPVAEASGSGYDSFGFSVNDGMADSASTYTLTIDVTDVNDPPVATDNTIQAIENSTHTFSAADFTHSDVEGDPLVKVRLQPVTAGSLWIDSDLNSLLDNGEVAVAANDEVLLADIPKLKFLAAENASGVGYATFQFDVHDGNSFSASPATITFDVTALVDSLLNGLSAHWKMEGDTLDSSGNGHDAVSTFPQFTTGLVGQALDVVDANSAMSYSGDVPMGTSFTIAAWVFPRTLSGTQTIFLKGDTGDSLATNNKALLLADDQFFLSYEYGASGDDKELYSGPGITLPLNQWSHILAVRHEENNGVISIYLNGVAAQVEFGSPTPNINSATSNIGAWNGSLPYDGLIDDLRVYNRALTIAEMELLYSSSVNADPVLSAIGDQSTTEDLTKTLTLTATDPDGDTLAYIANVTSGNVTPVVTGNLLDLIPDPDWNGTASVTVTINDGKGGTATETFNFTVTSVNDDPVLAPIGAQTTAEDTPKVITLAGTDVDLDSLTYTAVDGSGNVTTAISGTSLTLTPAADFNGTANITVTTDDGAGGTDSEIVVLTVTAVNDAPVLAPIPPQSTSEDTPLVITLAGTDVDLDSLAYTAVVDSGNVAAAVAGTQLTLTPDPDWHGSASITVTADDGAGGTDSKVVALTVSSVNDSPVLAPIPPQATAEDTPLVITLAGSDVDLDGLAYTAVVDSGNVSAAVAGTQLTLTPNPDWHGAASITLTADDGAGGTDSKVVALTVTAVNDDPVLTAIGAQTTAEDTPKVITLAGTDVDLDTLTFNVSLDSGNVTPSFSGTDLTLAPDPDWVGTVNITVTLDDGAGGTDSEVFVLTVTSVNDDPVLTAIGAQTTAEDTPLVIALAGTDVDLDSLAYTAVDGSGNVAAVVSGTSLTLTPAPDFNGTANITVTVDDGAGGTGSEVVVLTVTAVNDDPALAVIGSQTTAEDTPVVINLAGTDVDLDSLTFTAVDGSGNVTAAVSGTSLTLAPAADFNGTANITVTVDDGAGGTDSEVVILTVTPVNDDPVLTSIGAQTTYEDTPLVITLAGTDVDLDSLAYTAVDGSGNVTTAVSGTQLTLTPAADFNGTANITVTAGDGVGGTDSEVVVLTVTAVNDDPVLTPIGAQTTAEDTPLVIALAGTDVDLDSLSYTAVDGSGNVTAAVSGTQLTLTPAADFNGTANITVTADDGAGGTDSEVVVLTVTAVNDDPVLTTIGAQTTAEDTPLVIALAGTDVDLDSLTFSAVVDSGNVTAAVSGTQLTLTPDPDWNGAASITVTVDDRVGGVGTEAVALTVTSVNDSPVLVGISPQSTDEDSPLVLNLSATDVDLDSLVYSAVVDSGNVSAAVSGAQLTLTPDPDWSGSASITFTADDGAGGTDSQVLSLTVNPVNDPPVLSTIPNQTTAEDTPQTITLIASDAEQDALIFAAQVDSGDVTASVAGGQLTLTPADNWNGTALISITVSDGNGGIDSDAFQFLVSPANDDPVLQTFSPLSTPRNVPQTLTLVATDIDQDTLTYSATVNSGNVSATVSGDQLTLTPDLDWDGTASITITVSDGNGGTDSQSLSLDVYSTNDAPTGILFKSEFIPAMIDSDFFLGTLTTLDPQPGDTFTYSLIADQGDTVDVLTHFSIDGDRLLAAMPVDFNTTPSITIHIQSQDSGGLFLTEPITLTTDEFYIPVVQTDGALAQEDGSLLASGSILHDGNRTVLSRGILLDSSLGSSLQSPTAQVFPSHIQDGAGIEANLTGLDPGRKYFYRAYATNDTGTAYGFERHFTVEKALPSMFASAQDLGGGWYELAGFGMYYRGGNSGWVYHSNLGWAYVVENMDGYWFWTTQLGWSWARTDLSPYFWNHPGQAWFAYMLTNETSRIFYNATAGQLENYPLNPLPQD